MRVRFEYRERPLGAVWGSVLPWPADEKGRLGLPYLRVLGLFVLIVIGSTLMAACGGTTLATEPRSTQDPQSQDKAEPAKSPSRLTIHAQDSVFAPKRLDFPQGEEVTLNFVNDGELPHTFTIRDLDVDTGTVRPGASRVVSFTVPESNTPFVCTIHEFEGHVGTIVPN